MSGILMVVSGPSGVGKGAVAAGVCRRNAQVRISVSATTRSMREGEAEGVSYFFISHEQFDEMRRTGAFLECASVHGACYGTPRARVEAMLAEGLNVILEIDVQGAAQVRKSFPGAVHVFILPPSLAVLEARLRGRNTETEQQICTRLSNAGKELACLCDYDYAVINDDLDEAVEDVLAILRAERRRLSRICPQDWTME